MVNEQIIERGISDPSVIQAMLNVPRHKFVPEDQRPFAYDDRPLPIGYEQTISQPYVVAYMTEKLKLKSSDIVLEIGTGSGYQAAILSQIVKEVYSIEIVEPLANTAANTLNKLQYNNVTVKSGDGYNGWETHAPFDAIIITAAVEPVPPKLLDQLSENGRLIVPLGSALEFQYLVLFKKNKGKISQKNLLPVRFVPFTRKDQHLQ